MQTQECGGKLRVRLGRAETGKGNRMRQPPISE